MIHGSLRSFNLLEVMQFIGRKNGTLIITSPEGKVRIYVKDGNVRGFVYENERVKDIFRVRYRFLKVSEGSFEYVPGEVEIEDFSVPIDTLILSVVSMGDELRDLRISSPVHPDTVYVLSGDVENMSEDIRRFLKVAGPLLVKCSSARKIHEKTGLDLDMVRKFMTVLEATGIIRPVPRSRVKEDISLLGRVIDLLRRVWKWPK